MSDFYIVIGFVWWGLVFYLLFKHFWRTVKWLIVMGLFFGLGLGFGAMEPQAAPIFWWLYGPVLFIMPARWLWLELSGHGEVET